MKIKQYWFSRLVCHHKKKDIVNVKHDLLYLRNKIQKQLQADNLLIYDKRSFGEDKANKQNTPTKSHKTKQEKNYVKSWRTKTNIKDQSQRLGYVM